jgi:hypothetical protein
MKLTLLKFDSYLLPTQFKDMSTLAEDKVYRFRKAVITVRKDGIVEIAPNTNQCIDLGDYTAGIRFLEKKYKGRKFPVLFIPGENSEVTSEFRKIASSGIANEVTIADAVVVESLSHRMVSNFYIKFNKPSRPTRIFNNPDDAVAWLKSHEQ